MGLENLLKLELSTQHLIAAAKRRGIQVEIIDGDSNTIRLSRGKVSEIVMQATRTSKDTYIAPLLMTNKYVTKLLLTEAGIHAPGGYKVTSVEDGKHLFNQLESKPMVVKPLSTNFGVGITMLTDQYDQQTYDQAIELAFEKDSTVLVEDYIAGKEYRFLVIDNRVVGILHRVPANVLGDGKNTIAQLVEVKNQDPLRGTGYKKPLEKIQLGLLEKQTLVEQQLNFDSVPAEGETIYLRKNSNISTGGDSIDYTDQIHEAYHEIALQAAKAVGSVICGVDMIVNDIETFNEDGYSIIELNFNPAIHIHNAPYIGKNRHADDAVLDLLGF